MFGEMTWNAHEDQFIERLPAGPIDVELSPRELAWLEAYVQQPVSFATIQQEKKPTGQSATLAGRNRLKLIRDFNRSLQGRGRADELREVPRLQWQHSSQKDNSPQIEIRPSGSGWLVRGFGEEGHFKNLVGLRYVARLVESPGVPVGVTLL
jgi:alpha-amylase/alpha-mannosidase (GH57 family)